MKQIIIGIAVQQCHCLSSSVGGQIGDGVLQAYGPRGFEPALSGNGVIALEFMATRTVMRLSQIIQMLIMDSVSPLSWSDYSLASLWFFGINPCCREARLVRLVHLRTQWVSEGACSWPGHGHTCGHAARSDETLVATYDFELDCTWAASLQPWILEGRLVYRRAEGDEGGEQMPRVLLADNKEWTNAG